MMILGDKMLTPRFGVVKISAIFDSDGLAFESGYKVPSYFRYSDYGCDTGFEIFGKKLENNCMAFAAVRIEQ